MKYLRKSIKKQKIPQEIIFRWCPVKCVEFYIKKKYQVLNVVLRKAVFPKVIYARWKTGTAVPALENPMHYHWLYNLMEGYNCHFSALYNLLKILPVAWMWCVILHPWNKWLNVTSILLCQQIVLVLFLFLLFSFCYRVIEHDVEITLCLLLYEIPLFVYVYLLIILLPVNLVDLKYFVIFFDFATVGIKKNFLLFILLLF